MLVASADVFVISEDVKVGSARPRSDMFKVTQQVSCWNKGLIALLPLFLRLKRNHKAIGRNQMLSSTMLSEFSPEMGTLIWAGSHRSPQLTLPAPLSQKLLRLLSSVGILP